MSLLVTGPKWLDNLEEDDVLQFKWETHTAAGASVDPTVAGTIRIYKNNSITERASASGITDTRGFDGLAGIHSLTIDTSDDTDPGFWVVNENYMAVLVGATIDGVVNVNAVLAHFSTENRFHNMGAVSQDKAAADNFETMLDGTGGQKLTLGQLNIVASANDPAIRAIGSGAGQGVEIVGGTTGAGLYTRGGSTSGAGFDTAGVGNGQGIFAFGINEAGVQIRGGGFGNAALDCAANISGSGIRASGLQSSHGLELLGGANGHGISTFGGALSGDGIHAEATTDGDGIQGVGAGTGFDINGDLNGSVLSVVNQAAAQGAAINTSAINFTLTTGSVLSGTIADTVALDGVEHRLNDSAGTLDAEYEFNVTSVGVPVQVNMTGRSNGGNDDIIVEGFNYDTTLFQQIGVIDGKAGGTNDPLTFTLFENMVGFGANLGQVRIRFQNTGLTAATLSIDQLFVSFVVVSLSIGYQNGAVWIDTVNGAAGTNPFVNGTADNPSLTLADATTIAASIGLKTFQIVAGSSIALAQTYDSFVFQGTGWTLALANQDISNTLINGANVSGTVNVVSVFPRFTDCLIGSLITPVAAFIRTAHQGALTFSTAGDAFFLNTDDAAPGASKTVIDLGAAIGNTNLLMRDMAGDFEFRNMGQAASTDSIDFEGAGSVTLDASCIGGVVQMAGSIDFTNNGTGMTILDNARFENDKAADHILRRNAASARASVDGDTVTERSLLGADSKLHNRFDTTTNSGFATIFEEDDTTEFFRQTLVTDANADPIVSADTV